MYNNVGKTFDYQEKQKSTKEKHMSIVCSYIGSDGLILAADSRISQNEHGPFQVKSDKGIKYYYSKKHNIGIACVGIMEPEGENWIESMKKREDSCERYESFIGEIKSLADRVYMTTHFTIINPNKKEYEDSDTILKRKILELMDSPLLVSNDKTKGLKPYTKDCFYYIGQNELMYPHIKNNPMIPNMTVDAAYSKIIDLMTKAIFTGQLYEKHFHYYNSVGGNIHLLIMKYSGEVREIEIPLNVTI